MLPAASEVTTSIASAAPRRLGPYATCTSHVSPGSSDVCPFTQPPAIPTTGVTSPLYRCTVTGPVATVPEFVRLNTDCTDVPSRTDPKLSELPAAGATISVPSGWPVADSGTVLSDPAALTDS